MVEDKEFGKTQKGRGHQPTYAEGTRREVIKLVSATGIGLGGLSTQASADSSQSENTGPNQDADEKIHGIRIDRSFIYTTWNHLDIVDEPGYQYVLANVASGIPRTDLVLEIDGEKYYAGESIDNVLTDSLILNSVEGIVKLAGWKVPVNLNPDDITIYIEKNGRDTLSIFSEDLLNRYPNPPSFEVEKFGLPNAVQVGSKLQIPITVRNNGGRSGGFFGIVERSKYSRGGYIVTELDPGSKKTITFSQNYLRTQNTSTESVEYNLKWGESKMSGVTKIGG